MQKLLSLLVATFQAYQTAHHAVRGIAYFGDHEFLNAYEEVHGHYDRLKERADKLGVKCEEVDLFRDGARINSLRSDVTPEQLLGVLANMEDAICGHCERIGKESTMGTQNLLAGIADASETRSGHLKRRLMLMPAKA